MALKIFLLLKTCNAEIYCLLRRIVKIKYASKQYLGNKLVQELKTFFASETNFKIIMLSFVGVTMG